MDADGFALDELRLESLDGETVERGRAVEQHGMPFGHLFEDVPNNRLLALDDFLGAAHGVHVAEFLEAADDERLEKNECHFLGQAALVELELGSDDDDGTARIIDALAEEVLTETALLALEHVTEGLKRAVARTGDGTTMAAVVEERVDRFLQHALFVANDDLRRFELEEVFKPVVAVDDATIKIVEVGGGETSALERNERPEIRRDDGQSVEDHPIRTRARLEEALGELETLGQFGLGRLALGLLHLLLQILDQCTEVDALEKLLQRLGTHAGSEVLAVLLLGFAEFGLVEQLAGLEAGVTRVDDEVILVIDDALELLRREIEHKAESRWRALVEPDVRDGHGQLDVGHALAADAREGDLDAATVANHTLVLDALVFSAGALPVAGRTEDALAEKAALFRLERAVVDRLGIFYLAVAPGTDGLRGGHRDGDLVESRGGLARQVA